MDPVKDPALRLIAQTAASFHPDEDQARALPLAVGGALLDAEAAAAVAPGALEAVLARIDGIEKVEAGPRDERLAEVLTLPAPVRDAALESLAKGRIWKKPVKGIHVLDLPVGGEAHTILIRVEPGYGPPVHHHGGYEYALVLTGAYHDGHALYRAGELHVAPPDLKHRPVAQPGEVCYVLGATYGSGLRFAGLLGLLQKLTGR
ncbi:MAG: transcriptional activator ChrR [Caulobacteraceae bacterium]|nr:transcriptional activator ChrR [Caulobacteraceae bacterium]